MTEQLPKTVFNWSGGKDSSLALYKMLQEKKHQIVSLLTTINRDTKRSTMHGIPIELLKKQAKSIGIPLYIVDLTPEGNMEDYENSMFKAVEHFKNIGVTHFAFGDISLHDVRKYRVEKLEPSGISLVEPLWGMREEEVMKEFLESGLKTIIVTTMAEHLDERYIGRHIDEIFIKDLPENVDICGENGEYHSFCYDGPIFSSPISYTLGEPMKRTFSIKYDDGTVKDHSYWFANLNE
ncbi:hypothetical protein BB560_001879 [Smittium megazygosporum]|uniref:Diphthine--ammonia ligase n=1 Tax=Smittium megazygosporum TaxID=133381 RepID=A0A2T9YK29_9FUNG|nr:hypothetical protein BB560_006036 [Smittium megazygosporum]PVV03649.1 hypothetical protein BB560_001879 [Smittium megazygosporum]